LTFQKPRLDKLPEHANVSQMARALGVRRQSVQQWLNLPDRPLMYDEFDDGAFGGHGQKFINRSVLVRWLEETGRTSA
jgi:hypothetical protein